MFILVAVLITLKNLKDDRYGCCCVLSPAERLRKELIRLNNFGAPTAMTTKLTGGVKGMKRYRQALMMSIRDSLSRR